MECVEMTMKTMMLMVVEGRGEERRREMYNYKGKDVMITGSSHSAGTNHFKSESKQLPSKLIK